ncbi:hypothetical protein L1987_88227 [Smallanthus sonchifolius]|nr:hypothetical protein L1987_88227 [Smallanthus sonchifolius]
MDLLCSRLYMQLVKNLGSEVESNNLSLVGIWKESIRGGILLLRWSSWSWRWTSGILIQKTVSLLANGLENIKLFQIYTLPTVYQHIKKGLPKSR